MVPKPSMITVGTSVCPSCGEKIHGFEAACTECGQAFPANRWTSAMDIHDAETPSVLNGKPVQYDARIYRKGDLFRVLITQPSTDNDNTVIRNAGPIASEILLERFFSSDRGGILARTEWFLYDEKGVHPPQGIRFVFANGDRLRGGALRPHPGFFAETDPEGGIPGDAPRWKA